MHLSCCQSQKHIPFVEQLRQLKLYSMEVLRPVVEDGFEVRCYKGLGIDLQDALYIAEVFGQTDADQAACIANNACRSYCSMPCPMDIFMPN